ncbi:hypothetical protein AXG93_3354s1020 [Marchantia polymorpha subsp. ruderalis]|uniref:Uncharacterized protein n=1 Tax=Marchantia polymorpha subsp. ruderalis TaxID=1480154 RepID=A0A176VBJ5_MARPO|nr:hypothetical protein AXG93_3354s1020 [Marchantia polymorpha subsp. ruderalis]
MNPEKFMKDVEVDTELDEVPAITPPGRLRVEEEHRGAGAPRKRNLGEEEEVRRRESLAVPSKRRASKQARPKQKARKLILTSGNSVDTRRAAISKGSSSLEEEDGSTGVLGRLTDLPAPKAHLPSEEAHAPLEQGPSGQVPFKVPSEEAPSALRPLANIPTAEGRDEGTRLPSAEGATELPSAEPEWEDLAALTGVGSPTPLEMLAGHGVEAGAEEAVRPSARESSRISGATKILESKEDTPSEEEEVKSVQGTPTGVLCEQVVPLLRYLDRKAAKYEDPCQGGSYVELVRHQTRIKVAAIPEFIAQDQKYRNLEEHYNFLQDQWALARKLQKVALKLRDEMVANVQRKIDELRAKVQTNSSVEQIQIRNLADELVRKTQALEQSEAARRADEELVVRLQA